MERKEPLGDDERLVRDDPAVVELLAIVGSCASIVAFLAEVWRWVSRRRSREVTRTFRNLRSKTLELQTALDNVILRMNRHAHYADTPIIDNPTTMSGTYAILKEADNLSLRRNQKDLYAINGEIQALLQQLREAISELDFPSGEQVANQELFIPFDALLVNIGSSTFGEYCIELRATLNKMSTLLSQLATDADAR